MRRPRSLVICLVLAACGGASEPPATAPAVSADSGSAADDASIAGDDGGVSGDGLGADAGTRCAALLQPGGHTSGDASANTSANTSQWARVDSTGKLAYATLPKGDRVLDFSNAGYGGGGAAIPAVPASHTLKPSGGDDTAAIQQAIDAVSTAPLQQGIRGAVALAPGMFNVSATINIGASGVVLRGSGSGPGGTTLNATGSPRYVFSIRGSGSLQTTGTPATITDAYVPSGARTVHVDNAAGLAVGAPVVVTRPVTSAWVHFMGMDTLVRNGMPQTWLAVGSTIRSDRVVASVSGNAVTLDAPLSDALDAQYVAPGATVQPYTFAGRISQVGLESLHVIVPMQSVPISQPTYDLLDMDAVIDGWVKDVAAEEVTNGFVLGGATKRVTIVGSSIVRTAPIDGTQGYPFEYSIDGQQILVQGCSAQGDHLFSYATKSRTPGPNVLLDFTVKGTPLQIQPHERWATGLLVDNANAPNADIDLMNRGIDGSGHGWTIGFGVVWNSVARSYLVQQPPGSQNWAIGSTGTYTQAAAPGGSTTLPQGIVDSPTAAVAPQSLYLAQLCERVGPQALANIGY
jgi:hypothetical protein